MKSPRHKLQVKMDHYEAAFERREQEIAAEFERMKQERLARQKAHDLQWDQMMQLMKEQWAAMAMAARSEDEIAQKTKQQPEEVVAVINQANLVKTCVLLLERISMKASPKELLVHEKKCYVLLKRVSIPLEEESIPSKDAWKETRNESLGKEMTAENKKELVNNEEKTSNEQHGIVKAMNQKELVANLEQTSNECLDMVNTTSRWSEINCIKTFKTPKNKVKMKVSTISALRSFVMLK